MNRVTIPILPCADIDQTLSFWAALGFTTTYRQDKPYPYAVVTQREIQLHFRTEKRLDISRNFCMYLLVVANAAIVHEQFSQALRSWMGKVPTSGTPRLTRFKPGQTRFTLTDVSGNAMIVVQDGEKDQKNYEVYDHPDLSPLQKAVALAVRLRDYKEDDNAAIKVLQTALRKKSGERPEDIAAAMEMLRELETRDNTL